jgi:hypothetical protein
VKPLHAPGVIPLLVAVGVSPARVDEIRGLVVPVLYTAETLTV